MTLAALSCGQQSDPDDPVVARAHDQFLHRSDLRRMIPMGVTSADSASRAKALIEIWLREQVVIARATANLSQAERSFEEQLRNYRNSLILYAYERELVRQKMDTVVSEQEIRSWYEANTSNFQLKEDIVRARWFKVPISTEHREEARRQQRKLEAWFRSEKEEDRHELEVWLAQRGIEVHDTGRNWMQFTDLRNDVSMPAGQPSDLLASAASHKWVVADSANTSFVQVLEHRLGKSTSPLELVKQDIRGILLNQRKLKMIERMHEDLYREALEKREIEVF